MPVQVLSLTTEQIRNRVKILESNISFMNSEMGKLERDRKVHEARLKDNMEKIKLNKQLPFLVSNIVEVRPRRFPFARLLGRCAGHVICF